MHIPSTMVIEWEDIRATHDYRSSSPGGNTSSMHTDQRSGSNVQQDILADQNGHENKMDRTYTDWYLDEGFFVNEISNMDNYEPEDADDFITKYNISVDDIEQKVKLSPSGNNTSLNGPFNHVSDQCS